MAAKFSLSNRLKIGFSFAIVFLLVLATNRLDKRRFDTLSTSLTSVYEDRLVAKGHLYELNNIFHEQEKLYIENIEGSLNLNAYQNKVDDLITEFESTKLTNEEKSSFRNFQNHYKELKGYKQLLSNEDSDNTKQKIRMQLNVIQKDLDNLALIQLSEGESITKFAQGSLNSSSNMSKIELVIIILFGILVQFIIFNKIK